jgi:hypothetical protein
MLPAGKSLSLFINLSTKVAYRAPTRSFWLTPRRSMSNLADLAVGLTAPNGVKYSQPIGLFINNEWVKSSDGGKIPSINPT